IARVPSLRTILACPPALLAGGLASLAVGVWLWRLTDGAYRIGARAAERYTQRGTSWRLRLDDVTAVGLRQNRGSGLLVLKSREGPTRSIPLVEDLATALAAARGSSRTR